MKTGQDIYNLVIDLIDEKLASGAINGTTTAVYKARTPGILNIFQAENLNNGDLFKTFEISNTPIPNALGLTTGFDIKEFMGIDLPFECDSPIKAYYFEVDGPCTVYIEDYTTQWNILATITPTDSVLSFTPYKGIVTPTFGATRSRIRASGVFYYRIINRALFTGNFQLERVPNYRPWVKKTMPLDFKSVDQIIDEYPERQYTKESATKWEGKNNLYINYYYVGNIRITYKPIPVTITSLDQELEIDDVTAISAAYFVAAHLFLEENPASASFFNGRYMELKALSSTKAPVGIESIIDIYGLGGLNG